MGTHRRQHFGIHKAVSWGFTTTDSKSPPVHSWAGYSMGPDTLLPCDQTQSQAPSPRKGAFC